MSFLNQIGQYAQNAYDYLSPYFHGNAQAQPPQPEAVNQEQQNARNEGEHQAPPAPQAPNIFAAPLHVSKKKEEEDIKLDELKKKMKKLEDDIKGLENKAQNQEPLPAEESGAPKWEPYKKLELPKSTPKSRELLIALDWLRRDFEYTFEKKLEKHMNTLKELDVKQKLAQDLLEKVVERSDAQKNRHNGGFDCTDDNGLKVLLENARNAGIAVPQNKFVFSKAEKDLLVRNIERFGRELEKKIKEEAQAIEEIKTMRNQVFEMIKALHDRLSQIIKKMAEAIAGR
jgi:hypothetical protein